MRRTPRAPHGKCITTETLGTCQALFLQTLQTEGQSGPISRNQPPKKCITESVTVSVPCKCSACWVLWPPRLSAGVFLVFSLDRRYHQASSYNSLQMLEVEPFTPHAEHNSWQKKN